MSGRCALKIGLQSSHPFGRALSSGSKPSYYSFSACASGKVPSSSITRAHSMAANRPSPGGFVRPPEWAPHRHVIMAWPDHRNPSYEGFEKMAHYAREEVSRTALAISQFEPVELIVTSSSHQEAKDYFAARCRHHQVAVRCIPGDEIDLWMRDIAPIFTSSSSGVAGNAPGLLLLATGFNFNGWGNKFPSETTLKAAKHISEGTAGADFVESPLTLEGGAIETDGEGTMLATESSIINDNRNPGKSKQDIEAELAQCFGISKFIWIPGQKDLDVTDCHIDALARFVQPGKVLLSKPYGADRRDKARDPEEEAMLKVYREAREILRSSTDAKGRPFDIVEVEEANADQFEGILEDLEEGEETPSLSYANFLLVNGGVIVPEFGTPETDSPARKTMESLFGSQRTVVPVLLKTLPLLGGGIHCATQEVPGQPKAMTG